VRSHLHFQAKLTLHRVSTLFRHRISAQVPKRSAVFFYFIVVAERFELGQRAVLEIGRFSQVSRDQFIPAAERAHRVDSSSGAYTTNVVVVILFVVVVVVISEEVGALRR